MSTAVDAPDAKRYEEAFRKLAPIPDVCRQILRYHYHSPSRTVTAPQLAAAIGSASYPPVNSQYGRLAHLVGERLKYRPTHEWLGVLVTFHKADRQWHWRMRPEVAISLERLDWVGDPAGLLPDELEAVPVLVEGAVYKVTVNAYERNEQARQACLAAYGTNCTVCGLDFGARYGGVAAGFIHVHHLRPLSQANRQYQVDPIRDLRPVCPNCHAVLHRRIPPYTIDEIRALLTHTSSGKKSC